MLERSVRHGIASCQLLCTLGGERGLSLAQLLRNTGITPTQLADPSSEIEAAQELALIRNLVTELGDPPGLGLAAGARYHLTTMGIWGFVLVSSTTLRSALRAGLGYLDLTYSFSNIWLEELDEQASLVIEVDAAPASLRRFLVERDMAAILTLNHEVLSAPLTAHHITFAFPQPPHSERYRAALKVQPQFDAARNVLTLDAQLLDRPLPQANTQIREACEVQCRALLARRRVRAGIAGRVRDRLLREPRNMPDMEAIAAELCMTSRHLRRLLDDEGTSFRALADEVRQALAEQLLRSPRIKLDEIAERLGYAERASFIQAFKRWKGVTPRAFRSV
ncbi:MAG: AraC family transcriptional regulator [Nevskia sp.]|nr:AraC family transcriptional regulator [Nevskia sp.]